MRQRKKRSKRAKTGKPKYRSPLEERLHKQLKGFEYESTKMEYITKRNYIPDFIDNDKKILIEAKGFFRQGDDKKYASIKKCYPSWRMIFVFSDPNKKARKGSIARKDGSYLTLGEWATQNGWEYCDEFNLPKDVL